MRKKVQKRATRIIFTALVSLLLALCGCGPKEPDLPAQLEPNPLLSGNDLPAVSGGFVLSIEGQTITANQIINKWEEKLLPLAPKADWALFRRTARPHMEGIIVNEVASILLYQRAKKELGENVDDILKNAIEQQLNNFITGFNGDYARAEQVLKEEGMSWQDYRKHQERMILSHYYFQEKLQDDRPVTYSQLLEYYEDMKEEYFATEPTLKFQLIDIQPARLDTDANTTKMEAAEKLAEQLMTRLDEGEDFAELAKKYSHGHRAILGGEWKPLQPENLAKPYDTIAEHTENAEQDEIVGPIKTKEHIFIVKLLEKTPGQATPFEKVQEQIEQKIRLQRQNESINEVTEKIIHQAALTNMDEFIEYCLKKLYSKAL